MIASMRGEVLDLALDHVVLEASGVGYQLNATPATLAGLTAHPDPEVRRGLARNPALPAGAVHDLLVALAHPRTVLTDSFGSAAIDDSE